MNQNGYTSSKHAYQSTRNAHVIEQCCVTMCSLAVFLGGVELWVLFHVLRIKHETRCGIIARVTKRCSASICPHAVFCGGLLQDLPYAAAQHAHVWIIKHAQTDHSAARTAQRHRLNHNGYTSSKHAHQGTQNGHVIKQRAVTHCPLAVFLGGVEWCTLLHETHAKHDAHCTINAHVTQAGRVVSKTTCFKDESRFCLRKK